MQRTRRALATMAALAAVVLPSTGAGATSSPATYDPISMSVANVGTELAIARYATAVNAEAFGRLVEHNDLLAWIEAHPRPVVHTAPTTSASSSSRTVAPAATVTGACGGATNGADRYIQRESGGNPNVYNSGGSGAWGCYQLMPEHFRPGGACADMTYGAATPAQQAECASRLPLSAWGG